MRTKFFRLAALLLILRCTLCAAAGDLFADRYGDYVCLLAPEKLYLHVDRTCFTAGETLWFNGYLESASGVSPAGTSKFIYAEILDAAGKEVCRVKIRKAGGGFPGHIDIPEDLRAGEYTLRAYSLWQLNRPCEYMFNQRITIIDRNGTKTRRSPSLSAVDVSFYPEGGRYFVNGRAIVGFKAMDRNGRGVDLRGRLVDSDGKVVCDAVTVHDGMGSLGFFPLSGQSYYIEAEDGLRYKLPDPSDAGASVSVVERRGRYVITVTGSGAGPCTLYVRNAVGIRPVASVNVSGTPGSVLLEGSALRSGINHAVLVDAAGHIVSDRPFFVGLARSEGASCLISKGPESAFGGHSYAVSLKDASGSPLDGECSVSVIRAPLGQYVQDEGIVSYMALSSEIRGRINDPSWYFDAEVPAVEREAALDLLMMIQGWSYYDLPTIADPEGVVDLKVPEREQVQSVKGRITRTASSKNPSQYMFYALIPKVGYTAFMNVEEGSRFVLDSLDLPENSPVLIKVMRNGFGLDYCPEWDGETFAPEFRYPHLPPPVEFGTEEADSLFDFAAAKTDTLEAAVVSAEFEAAYSDIFDGRTETSQAYEFFKDRTLVEYLRYRMPYFSYDGQTMVNTRFIASLTTSGAEDADSSSGQEVKLLVDGLLQDWDTYDTMRMDNVASISISQTSNVFYDSPGGMVAISMRHGASISDIKTESSLLIIHSLGYQEPLKFYSPVYDTGDPMKSNTVWWNPSVKISGGSAELEFADMNPDDAGYIIRVEGRTDSGVPFSGRL